METKREDSATAAASTAADKVYKGVLEAISLQRLAPGTKLPEENLAQVFGVSRPQTRTALSRLRLRGLVDMEPNRSAQIASPSVDDVVSIFNVRLWIEPEIAAEVASNLNSNRKKALRSHMGSEQSAREAGDRIEATRLAGKYHSLIASFSANTVGRKYVDELVDRSFLAIFLYQRVGEVMCVNEDHEMLLKAFEANDSAAARAGMESHLRSIMSRLDLSSDGTTVPDLNQAFRGIKV